MTDKILKCGTHGTIPWEGHIVCAACGALYQTSDPTKPRYATEFCKCHKRLAPYRGARGGGQFTARSVCKVCFEERTKGVPQ